VQVPKTLKTPRTISVEPSYMMLMQQSIAKPLMSYLESKRFGFKSIRFSDQSVNRDLARRGSIDGSISTIDLSDASDLVPLGAVVDMFKVCPTFLNYILDCRTSTALLPDKRIIDLKKFASMGSALCFPIESMFFFTVVLYSLVRQSGRSPSRRLLLNLAKDVAIYGDDILVPSLMGSGVMADLELFGLRVNQNKSFYTGFFRESCGGDYYKGVDVTPLYVRQWDDTGKLVDSSTRISLVALSNSLYMKGLWHACDYLREVLQRKIKNIPYSRFPIGILHFASYIRSDKLSWDANVHGYRVKGVSYRPKKEKDTPSTLSGYLIGSFGDRLHSDSRRDFEQFCKEPPERMDIRFGFATDSHDFNSREDDVVDFNINGQGQYDPYLPYSSLDIKSASSTWSRWSKHLDVSRPRSLVDSERPYVLNSKRRWTASPAGLTW